MNLQLRPYKISQVLHEKFRHKVDFPCTDASCEEIPCRYEEHKPNFVHDPVGFHIIELRVHILELTDICARYKKLLKKNMDRQATALEDIKYKRLLKPLPEFPPLGKKWPSTIASVPHEDRDLILMTSRKTLTEADIKEIESVFVQDVLCQVGVDDANKEVFEALREVTNTFLLKFMQNLHDSRTIFRNTNKEIVIIDHALKAIGYGGIAGLHNFYKEKILMKHKKVFELALQKRKECASLRKQLIHTSS